MYYELSGNPAPIFADLVFQGNSGNTGGIAFWGVTSSVTLQNVLFVGNIGGASGAILADTVPELILEACTVTGNSAGIRWWNIPPTITDSIVWGNPAPGLGQDVISSSDWSVIHTSHSDVGGYAGADATTFDQDPSFVSAAKLFDRTTGQAAGANKLVVSSGAIYAFGDTLEIGRDGVARSVTATTATTVTFAPPLAAPAPNGVPIVDWGPGAAIGTLDYHLAAGSACIDAADPNNAPLTDLAGVPRGAEPDIGAYESP